MKLTHLAAIALVSFLFGTFANASDPVEVDQYLKRAQTYYELLNNPEPEAAVESYLQDTLLTAFYETESYTLDFERELDQLAAVANKDPKFRANPLQSDTYKQILRLDDLTASLSDELAYVYGQLLSKTDDSKCGRLLNAIDRYFSELSDEDRFQLAEVESRLNGLRTQAPNADEEAIPPLSPISLRTRHKARALHARPHSPRLEKELIEETQRNPQPRMSLLSPGAGPSGNVTGDEFPDGVFALTFDDGPDPKYTNPLMEALLSHKDKVNPNGAPASFFWLAQNVGTFKDTVTAAIKKGFSLNCHSWTHANLARSSYQKRVKEVLEATAFEERAFGRKINFYRCPGGACYAPAVPQVRQMISDLHMIHAYWNIDSRDWKHRNAERTFNWTVKQMQIQKRGIVLMHDIHPYSLAAAKMLLNWIGEQNNSNKQRIELHTIGDAVSLHNALLTPIGQKDVSHKPL